MWKGQVLGGLACLVKTYIYIYGLDTKVGS